MRCQQLDSLELHDLIARRELFSRVGTGLTGAALAWLLGRDSAQANDGLPAIGGPGHGASQGLHHRPKAMAVIQLFQHGGPSHMDLLDPKPELTKRDGQPMPKYFTDLVAISSHGGLLGVPYKFHPAGQCGVEYSELLPHTAKCADDIAVVRSMHAEHNNHEQALWQIHTGRTIVGRPTVGAWVSYALGAGADNLPAYAVLRDDANLPVDGARNWTSGFLPPKHQGVHFRHTGSPLLNMQPASGVSAQVQDLRRGLLDRLNAEHRAANPTLDPQLEARIASYQLAARMQTSAAESLDLARETAETHTLYGLNNKQTESYGRRLLMARRLVERGVRYVQVMIRGQMWDTHANNAIGTKNCCLETDLPTAGLLTDLKRRGLLDSTLVIWGGEFGRTPVSQGGNGRDHHKQGFSLWMAGGGIRGGQAYGATDELGYHAVENRVQIADLHATVLHLMGLDHRRVSFDVDGRPERLTDVYDAKLLTPLLA